MEPNIQYKGYEVLGIQNKKIVAQIKDNIHLRENRGEFGNKLFHEPSITFKFGSYEKMVSFIDQNPR